jgi:hypothetical protein
MVDQIQLELVLVAYACWIEAKHPHFLEQKAHAAGGAEIARVAGENVAYAADGTRGIVGCAFDQQRHAVGSVTLVENLLIVRGLLARGASDRRVGLVLRHVHRARVLQHAPQGRIRGRVGPSRVDRDRNVLGHAGELLGHPVPTREHSVFSDFEYASHGTLV